MLFLKYQVVLNNTNRTITILRESAMKLKINDKVSTMDGEGTIIRIMM